MALGHNRQHLDDDVEANAADRSLSNGGFNNKDLGEYEALDRFITSYTTGGKQQDEEDENQKPIAWWKFWKFDDSAAATQSDGSEGKAPAAWLETDIHSGISTSEVEGRRKRFGWNELTSEKENQFRKFLSFFEGPILYGEFHVLLG